MLLYLTVSLACSIEKTKRELTQLLEKRRRMITKVVRGRPTVYLAGYLAFFSETV